MSSHKDRKLKHGHSTAGTRTHTHLLCPYITLYCFNWFISVIEHINQTRCCCSCYWLDTSSCIIIDQLSSWGPKTRPNMAKHIFLCVRMCVCVHACACVRVHACVFACQRIVSQSVGWTFISLSDRLIIFDSFPLLWRPKWDEPIKETHTDLWKSLSTPLCRCLPHHSRSDLHSSIQTVEESSPVLLATWNAADTASHVSKLFLLWEKKENCRWYLRNNRAFFPGVWKHFWMYAKFEEKRGQSFHFRITFFETLTSCNNVFVRIKFVAHVGFHLSCFTTWQISWRFSCPVCYCFHFNILTTILHWKSLIFWNVSGPFIYI